MERKQFIRSCCMVSLSSSALASLLQSCAGTNYFAQTIHKQNQIIIKKSEFTSVHQDKKRMRKYVLIKTEKLNFPIILFKLSDEDYSALLMECSHKGCELQPQGDFLHCPCHGSEFNNKGVVQNPPAEENLFSFKTTADHENIYIQL